MRTLKYSEALAEATLLAMEDSPNTFLMGEGIDDPKGAFGTTTPALKRFGAERVFDMPLSENAMTGVGIGAAIAGHPCVMIHMRSEFLLLAMDQVINHAAKWHYMFAGKMNVPITIRCLVGRGWGQAAQHSQSFHALFATVPGLKVMLPSSPYDAKGLLYSAILDPNPVICIEHRWLYDKTGEVPPERYHLPLGKASVVAEGKDVTCVALSYGVLDALSARTTLLREGIDLEVIDLRSARPLDTETVLQSLRKTGRLIVCDISGPVCGISAEIAAVAASLGFTSLKAPVTRITLPDAPTPCSPPLEEAYYPGAQDIVSAARRLTMRTGLSTSDALAVNVPSNFTGPF